MQFSLKNAWLPPVFLLDFNSPWYDLLLSHRHYLGKNTSHKWTPSLSWCVSEKWCKRAPICLFYILLFGSEFSDKRKGFRFFNFRKNAAAGTATLSGIKQRFSMGRTMFQTVAAKWKRRTVDTTLQIILFTKMYVKLLPCIYESFLFLKHLAVGRYQSPSHS